MEQIAQELDVALLSYSMTHHTRQSALGLPFISHKVYDGVEYDIYRYLMGKEDGNNVAAVEMSDTDYKNLNTQDKIVKLNHILFEISFVEEEDINLLSKKMALIYKDAVEWVWFKLKDIGYKIVAKNVTLADHKYNEEEDFSKLSKEELIARLKEATK